MKTEKIILGTVQFGLDYGINNSSGKPGEKEVFNILASASEKNIQILDTADSYGSAAILIGHFQEQNGYHFDINTKFTYNKNIPVSTQLQRSLSLLKVNFINTYFYHRFEDMITNPDLHGELGDLKSKGWIKKIGVSVYGNDQFEQAIENDGIDVIQLPFNLLDNRKKRGELLKLAKRKNKDIQTRSVFLQGLFFKKKSSFPAYLQPLIPYLKTITYLADEYKGKMESIALQYALHQPEIDYVLIGVDNEEQLSRNLGYAQSQFPDELFKAIDQIDVKETTLLSPNNWR